MMLTWRMCSRVLLLTRPTLHITVKTLLFFEFCFDGHSDLLWFDIRYVFEAEYEKYLALMDRKRVQMYIRQ